MKRLLLFSIVALLFLNGSCERKTSTIEAVEGTETPLNNTSSGLTSKEAIFEHLKTVYPDLDEQDVCIIEVQEFGNLFVMGFFAHDRGCSVNSMFFEGNELPGDHSKAVEIMSKNDFSKDSEKLVNDYHINVANTFKTVVWSINEDFDESQFKEPTTYTEDGKVISVLWIQRPSGMIKERSYYLSKLIFDLEGNFVALEKSKQFSISY